LGIKRSLRKVLRHIVGPVLNDVLLHYPLVWKDRRRVVVHPTARIHNALLNVRSGRITVEENVFFGHNVTLLTGEHDYTKFDVERLRTGPMEGNDITIRRGAWVSSNATILGPCEIGEHAVVCAGSVVTRNVLPYEVVAGVPARFIRVLQAPSCECDEPTDPGDASQRT
jgi:acetyltransferase-like isoleucine patch superfamily enzyme